MTKELIERITQAREHTQLYGQVLPALWVYQPFTMNAGELFSAIEALQARVVELGDELERERICHAACGVIALSNTPESAATMRQMKDEYRSASVQDVCNAVDREMALRVERDSLAAELAAARAVIKRVQHIALIDPPHTGQMLEIAAALATPIPPVREPCEQEAPYIGHDCDPTLPDSSKVICPACCTQFRAIPTDVQNLMLGAGFEPPFKATSVREPLSYRDILRIYNEVGPEDGVPYRFAGAIEAITKEIGT